MHSLRRSTASGSPRRPKLHSLLNQDHIWLIIQCSFHKVVIIRQHFWIRTQWCCCFWSEGHLKVIKGHFKVIFNKETNFIELLSRSCTKICIFIPCIVLLISICHSHLFDIFGWCIWLYWIDMWNLCVVVVVPIWFSLKKKKELHLGGVEPATFWLTAQRANQLRHGNMWSSLQLKKMWWVCKNRLPCIKIAEL